MTKTLANGYSNESAQRELSNEYQHEGSDGYQKSLRHCAWDESSLSIGRVKLESNLHLCLQYFQTSHFIPKLSSEKAKWIETTFLTSSSRPERVKACLPDSILYNPSNAEATVVQSTRMQRFLKNILTLSCWY